MTRVPIAITLPTLPPRASSKRAHICVQNGPEGTNCLGAAALSCAVILWLTVAMGNMPCQQTMGSRAENACGMYLICALTHSWRRKKQVFAELLITEGPSQLFVTARLECCDAPFISLDTSQCSLGVPWNATFRRFLPLLPHIHFSQEQLPVVQCSWECLLTPLPLCKYASSTGKSGEAGSTGTSCSSEIPCLSLQQSSKLF